MVPRVVDHHVRDRLAVLLRHGHRERRRLQHGRLEAREDGGESNDERVHHHHPAVDLTHVHRPEHRGVHADEDGRHAAHQKHDVPPSQPPEEAAPVAVDLDGAATGQADIALGRAVADKHTEEEERNLGVVAWGHRWTQVAPEEGGEATWRWSGTRVEEVERSDAGCGGRRREREREKRE